MHAGTGMRGWPAAGGQLDRIDFVDRESIEDLTIRKGKPFLLLHLHGKPLRLVCKGLRHTKSKYSTKPNHVARLACCFDEW